MFRGQFPHSMDAKGRISLPSRYRDGLDGDTRLIVTNGLSDPCLDVFPMKRWEELERRVAELPRFDPNVVKFRRIYLSAAVECELDAQGRILVPPGLRERARLVKDVVWIGMTEKAELWSQEMWTKSDAEAREDMSFVKVIGEQIRL